MYHLENSFAALSVDARGNLTELKNGKSGHDYAGSGGLWRLIYSRGQELEREAAAEGNSPEITVDGNGLTLNYPSLTGENGEALAVSLRLTIRQEGDAFHFGAELENREEGVVIRELHYPLLRRVNLVAGQRLIWSQCGGQRFEEIAKTIRARHTQYMAKDFREVRLSTLYPGNAAANLFLFENDAEGLYFASHDPSFQYTLHLLGEHDGELLATMVKYPYLATGGKREIGEFVISPYSGSWHQGAKKYRAWADTWFRPQAPHPFVETMNGWQRIIMRHQYGEIHYRYDQMAEIARDGIEAGIDTLFMFGWHQGGHDSEYPEYTPDASMGGLATLKEEVRRFHAAGGKLMLYYNGQLIDRDTDFYRQLGHRISVRRENGMEHLEQYAFSGNGTALREFGNKTFATACFGCPEWFEVLKGCIDQALEIGADAVFFDQLGWLSRPCFDPSHGHEVPLMNPMKVKAEVIARLKAYLEEKSPGTALGIEWHSDLTAQHVDLIHSVTGGNEANHDWMGTGEKPRRTSFMEFFGYLFPEVRYSDRTIRDDTDIERRVNLALVKGLRSDVEIYRCRRTIRETPHYQAYLTEANRFRDRNRKLILNGRFGDTEGFTLDADLDASVFHSNHELAIQVTQSHRDSLETILTVPNATFIGTDGLGNYQVEPLGENRYRIRLGRHALALCHFHGCMA